MECLQTANVVVKSPGIPHTSPEFLRLRDIGVAVTSLTDLWLNDNTDRVIAVTGTKGKSTTSALIHHLLGGLGVSSTLVGNGGTPVTAGDHANAQVAVAEVSSYQAADLTVSPRLAVITSLYPEHLPWHGSFEQYVEDKLNLVAHGPEVVVVPDATGNLGASVTARIKSGTNLVTPAQVGLSASDRGITWDEIGELTSEHVPLRGRHNVVNLMLALTAVSTFLDLGRSNRLRLMNSVHSFAPLAHRLETVPSHDGRLWVDDSLATAPEAVVAALESFPGVRVTLIVGGSDRGLTFAPLIDYLAKRPSAASVRVIAVGPAGARLIDEAGNTLRPSRLPTDFGTALDWASEDPRGSDVVMLSPGAPSFDEFANYEERSAAFRAAAARAGADVSG